MSKRMEDMLREYTKMAMERRCLREQLAHFKGASDADVIDSMYTPKKDGERVQTSGTSDKTAQIALSYEERRDRINSDWRRHLEWRLCCISDQLDFLESALRSLPDPMNRLMWDMVVEQMKWEALEEKYSMGHTTVYRLRRKAIAELDQLYEAHKEAMTSYMLG